MYEHCTFIIGCYPCLYCLVYNHNMATPLSVRGRAPSRTFEAICAGHQHNIASETDKNQAKNFHNCNTEPIINIPISHVGILASRNVCMITPPSHTHNPPHTHTHTHTHTTYVCTVHVFQLNNHVLVEYLPCTHSTFHRLQYYTKLTSVTTW